MLAKGINGQISINGNKLKIERKGFLAKVNVGLFKGDKEILLDSITSVEFRNPTIWGNGYIEFIYKGNIDSHKRGLTNEAKNENAVMFNKKQKKDFLKIKEYIEKNINKNTNTIVDVTEQIKKFNELKKQGIITKDEFEIKKNKLLNL